MLAAGDAVFGADPGRAAPAGHANPYLVDVPEGLALFGVFRGPRPQTLAQLRERLKPLQTEFQTLLNSQRELENKIGSKHDESDDQVRLRIQRRRNGIRMGYLTRQITVLEREISLAEAKETPDHAHRAREQAAKAAQEARKARMGAGHLHAPRL